MSGEFVRLRPRHLAAVWGTAVGQLVDLAMESWRALAELGAAEADLPAGDRQEIVLELHQGPVPQLRAGALRGETFDEPLPESAVVLTPQESPRPNAVAFVVSIDEPASGSPIRGDIYRGEVVDERGRRVASVALDAGS